MAEILKRPSQIFNLECGTYKANGYFSINSKQLFTFTLNRNSFSRAELLVIGGSSKEKLLALNKVVSLEFYVPQPIQGTSGKNVVYLQTIETSQVSSQIQKAELIELKKCGLNEEFSN